MLPLLKKLSFLSLLVLLSYPSQAFSPGSESDFSYSLDDAAQIPAPLESSFYLTQGKSSVLNGAFQYSIPIHLPPTINNIGPELTFTYSSSNPTDSHFGVGWQLTGIGAITRCRAIFATEGVQAQKSNPRYSKGDRLCLNGQKLILRDGPKDASDNAYWAPSAEYKTEIDTFAKIVANSDHTQFTVYLKSGLIQTYGDYQGQNSTFYRPGFSSGDISRWSLSKTEDRYGNSYRVVYDYNVSDFEQVIRKIEIDPNVVVSFEYKQKANPRFGYDKGHKYIKRKIIDKIIVKKVNLLTQSYIANVRSYKFGYPSGAVSGLTTSTSKFETITECGYKGGEGQDLEVCGLPITLVWPSLSSSSSYRTYLADGGADHLGGFYKDIDGDGYSDHVKEGNVSIRRPSGNVSYSFGGTGNHLTPVKFKDGIGIVKASVSGSDTKIYLSRKKKSQNSFSSTLLHTGVNRVVPEALVTDFNNDGLEDVCVFDRCYLQSAETGELDLQNSWDPLWRGSEFVALDVNSDGLMDRVRSIRLIHSSTNAMSGEVESLLGTGQGFDNNIDPNFPHWDVTGIAGGQLGVQDLRVSNPGNVGVSSGSIKTMADLNGDGLRDLVYVNSVKKLSYRLNTGYGLTEETATSFSVDHGLGLAADFNGDGLEDYLHTWGDNKKGYVYVYIAAIENGRVVFTRKPVTGIDGVDSNGVCDTYFFPSACQALANRVVTDDKLMAIGDVRDVGSQYYAINKEVYQLGGPPNWTNLLSKITDGVGRKVEVNYGNLTPSGNGGIYAGDGLYKPTLAEYPYAPIPRSLYVVLYVEQSDGVTNSGYNRDYYLYQGGKADVRGRGNVGFSEIRKIRYNGDTTNSSGQRVPVLEDRTYTQYHQDFPYIGRIKRLTTFGTNGDAISDRFSYYETHPENSAFPYEKRRFEENYESIKEEHPTAPLIPIGVREQSFIYDQFGNLTNSHLIEGAPANYYRSDRTVRYPLRHTVINNDYNNDEADYLIGFLTQTRKDTYFHDGSDFRSRCVTFAQKLGTLDADSSVNNCDWRSNNGLTVLVSSYLRNDKGVVTQTNFFASDPTGAFSSRTTTYEDFEYDIYPRKITNSLGQPSYLEYDHRHSTVEKNTDANGFIRKTFYDPWGRTVEASDLTTGNRALSGIKQCTSQSCPSGSKYYSSSQVVNAAEPNRVAAPVTVTFYDMLGRERRRQTHSLGGVVKIDTEYDKRGNVKRISDAYSGSAAANWTVFTYDEQDRVKTQVHDRLETNVVYDTSGYALKSIETVITDTPNGQKSQTETTLFNSLGQVRKVVDNMSNTVDYTYDSQGNLESTIVNGNADTKISITHDIVGNKTKIVDPDAGSTSFVYNGFGEQRFQIWQQGTANEKSMEFVYDALGRKVQRIDTYPNQTKQRFRWDWDVQYVGTLAGAYRELDQIGRFFTYNSKGQVATLRQAQASNSAKYAYTYDGFGRVAQINYPLGNLAVQRKYHALGQHVRTVNAQNQQPIWELGNIMDAQGNLTQQRYGNGVITQHTYHPTYGSIEDIEAGIGSTANIQSLSFTFDGFGNLYERELARIRPGSTTRQSEIFDYDDLNRLISDGTPDSASPCGDNYCYDSLGNLTYKTEVGSLSYARTNGAGVHAITNGAGKTYRYDSYGNMTSRGSQTVAYDVFNKPTRINNTYLIYGADHELLKQTSSETGVDTLYAYGLFGEKFETLALSGGVKKYRHYVDGVMLFETKSNTSTTSVSYLHYDHLGSVETITNSTGGIKDHLSYNAWGERRDSDWTYGDPTMGMAFFYDTQTGYTGHEMLDQHGLVHMGGRVYDPLVSRFMSADLFVQSPYNTQSYNRYSYVFNNPLRFYDPTGYQADDKYDDSDPCEGMANCGVSYGYAIDWGDVFAQAQIEYYYASMAASMARDYSSHAGNFFGAITETAWEFSPAPVVIGGAMEIYVTIDTGGNITEITHVFGGMVTKFATKKVSSARQALETIGKFGGLRPTQKAVSGPQVDRLAERMKLNGFDPASPVKVDGDLVVDGHHRVMAAKKAGVDIVTTPGTASNSQRANSLDSFDDIKVDPEDWY